MNNFEKIQIKNPKLATAIMNRGGFILDAEVEELISIDRLITVLVRCNNGRFTTPVQNLKHFIGIIDSHRNMVAASEQSSQEVEWVRDVSLLA